jgi:hypothetical protein
LETKGVGYARHRSRLKEVIELRTLPPTMVQALAPFAPLFSKSVFRHAQVLLIGAFPQLRVPGRSVPPCAMGLDQQKRFHRYHRVLSRASWSSLEVARVLLGLVVGTFVPEGGPLEPFPKRLAPWGPRHQATGFRIRGAARQIELRPVSNREAHPFRETL